MTDFPGSSRIVRLGATLVMLLVVSAWSAPSAIAADTAPMSVTAAASAGPVDTSDYVLGVSDKVRITVYNEKNLTGEFPVNANGTVSMPLIGDIKAAGVTADALRTNIEKKLADGYLVNPRVSIDVLTFRPYYILGEVTKAGEYPYSSGLTVLNAVATAQGFTYRANKRYVFIKHAGQTSEDRVRLTDGLPVQPGDTLRIGERFF